MYDWYKTVNSTKDEMNHQPKLHKVVHSKKLKLLYPPEFWKHLRTILKYCQICDTTQCISNLSVFHSRFTHRPDSMSWNEPLTFVAFLNGCRYFCCYLHICAQSQRSCTANAWLCKLHQSILARFPLSTQNAQHSDQGLCEVSETGTNWIPSASDENCHPMLQK